MSFDLNGPFTVHPHGKWKEKESENKHPHAKRRGRVRPTAKGGKGGGQKEYNPDAGIEKLTREMLWEQHPVRYPGNVQFGVSVYYDARTTVDLDNLIKHIWDSMNGWWFKDDSQITRILESDIYYDKTNPRAEVWIADIPVDEVGRLGMMPRGVNWDPKWDAPVPTEIGAYLTPGQWARGNRYRDLSV